MRYCPVCNRNVGTKYSQGQIIGVVVLMVFFFLIPGLIYLIFARKRNCVTCGNITLRRAPEIETPEPVKTTVTVIEEVTPPAPVTTITQAELEAALQDKNLGEN